MQSYTSNFQFREWAQPDPHSHTAEPQLAVLDTLMAQGIIDYSGIYAAASQERQIAADGST